MPILKIAVTGPESSGKSQMTKELAAHFNEPFASEFAVDYLSELERPYNFEDLKHIAIGQLILKNRAHMSAKEFLFLDTDLTVIKIWSEFKFGKTDSHVDHLLKSNHAHFYLLMDIDLPYQIGSFREHPELEDRKKLFSLYIQLLDKMDVPYKVISGKEQERIENAKNAIKEHFKAPSISV